MEFCDSHRIPYHVMPPSMDWKLSSFEIPISSSTKQWDVGIVASFGYLMPRSVISSFRSGMINVHPSLLPQYIGCAPIPYALSNGDKVTGVSIIDIVPKLDGGPILAQNTESIDDDDTFRTLSIKLADLGGRSLCGVLSDLEHHRIHSISQKEHEPEIKALYESYRSDSDLKSSEFQLIKTRKIPKSWSFIDWTLSAERIVNRHRAINGLLRNSRSVLGTKTEREKLLILIDEVAVHRNEDELGNESIIDIESLFADQEHQGIGSVAYCKHRNVLFVKCGRNQHGIDTLLKIKKLRIAPSLASQHLPNFTQFVQDFGHFVPVSDEQEYAQRLAPFLKNRF